MGRRRHVRSISVPIVLAAIAVPLSIALLVGWTFLVVQNSAVTSEAAQNAWLLALGGLSFTVIMGVLLMFAVFLAREILEVRRQDSFIDSVTHELKSPLASIKLCIETLGREGLGQEQRDELRQMMFDDIARLSSFIDDVLQASRLAHDRVGMSVSRVEVGELVRRCVDLTTARHRIDPARVKIDVEPGLVASTDRAALEIVVKNLVDNAIKYSAEEVDVTIEAREEAGRLHLSVRDRGIGIPPRERKRIFHRFYRVAHESVRSRKGTGLGLFVVSSLVRNLGGRIEASTPPDGVGTCLRLVLPGAVPMDARSPRREPLPTGSGE